MSKQVRISDEAHQALTIRALRESRSLTAQLDRELGIIYREPDVKIDLLGREYMTGNSISGMDTVERKAKVCKNGHLYRGDKCLVKGCKG